MQKYNDMNRTTMSRFDKLMDYENKEESTKIQKLMDARKGEDPQEDQPLGENANKFADITAAASKKAGLNNAISKFKGIKKKKRKGPPDPVSLSDGFTKSK